MVINYYLISLILFQPRFLNALHYYFHHNHHRLNYLNHFFISFNFSFGIRLCCAHFLKDLLKYTSEGVLIRARYVRQLDNIHKTEKVAKHEIKKMISDFNHKLEEHHKEITNQAYSKGLHVLLGDILTFAIQYQNKFSQYEFQQREQITATIAQFLMPQKFKLS